MRITLLILAILQILCVAIPQLRILIPIITSTVLFGIIHKLHHKEKEHIKSASSLTDMIIHYERAAHTDPLTGLLNRRGGEETITKQIARSRRLSSGFSVIMLDIDHFKKINDNYGHANGDVVISKVAECIMTNLRAADFAIRWGGEEFLICLPDTNLYGATLVAEKIRHVIESVDLGICNVTASLGCAELGEDDFKVALARADMHLYMAKHSGRNLVYPVL